jgi:hypothetical protein
MERDVRPAVRRAFSRGESIKHKSIKYLHLGAIASKMGAPGTNRGHYLTSAADPLVISITMAIQYRRRRRSRKKEERNPAETKPSEVITVSLQAIDALEIRCGCGAIIRFSMRLKKELPLVLTCFTCSGPLWTQDTAHRELMENIVNALQHWNNLDQTRFSVQFAITREIQSSRS